jgi:two-component system KDP operon response regulator KdpE
MENSEKILVIDHDLKIVHLLRELFTAEGYRVLSEHEGERAILLAAQEQPDLIFLEKDLAGSVSAFEVIRRVRAFSDVPLLVLTAFPDQEDVLRVYALGADDCITKPFNPKILVARMKVLLKRCQHFETPSAEIVCQDLTIQVASRKVLVAGVEVYLSEKEFDLLLVLARHRDKVLLHEQLLSEVWGKEFYQQVDYLRSYIHVLRRKLEKSPANPALIISKPGVGYMLVSRTPESGGG